MLLRLLVAVVLLALVPGPARGEAVPAVLTAMPNEQAEQRYLTELCACVATADIQWRNAMDASLACLRRHCGYKDLERAVAWEKDTRHAHDTFTADYTEAETVYRAKHGVAPICEATSEAATASLAQRVRANLTDVKKAANRALGRPHTPTLRLHQ